MSFFIGLLTVVLVLDCLLLILLVLIQLPKKEAGAGLAFGGAATDALFGAGTGNVLTKVTKYATITFFALLLVIGVLQPRIFNKSASALTRALEEQGTRPNQPPPSSEPATPSAPPIAVPAADNAPTTPVLGITNLESVPAPQPAPAAPK